MTGFLSVVLLLVGLAIGAKWLSDHPGDVVIHWFDYDITVHIALAVAALLLLTFVVGFLSINVWQLFTWGKRRRARHKYRTLESGLRQLTLGVTALAMGNDDLAQEALEKAALALPSEPLPQLLTAQLLQRQGKHADARVQFRALMAHEATAALATRRLIEEHLAAKEWGEAAKLAEEARREAPKDRWLALTLIDLYARTENISAMLALTEGWQWQSPLSKEERHRYAALAHYLAAGKQAADHRREQSLRHAVGYAPEFLPAVVEFARVLQAEGETRRARKWLLAAWEKSPSLPLIDPILSSLAEESPRAQLRFLKPFLQGAPCVAHHLLVAHQAMMQEEWERASSAVEAALKLEESKPALRLMAEIKQESAGPEAASAWLARAVAAPAAESWICDHCGTQHDAWKPHCSACDHFDSLRYTRPETRITSLELV